MDYDVAVVGAGFSAIAVAINLLRILPPAASIAIIGDDPAFGRGTAYRTELHLHRLNVPAGRMSVFPDEPDHFVKWLERQGRSLSQGDFASRGDYGLYLRDTLASVLRERDGRARLSFIKARALACEQCDTRGLIFRLANGEASRARSVVLCLGIGNADLPLGRDKISNVAEAHIIRNPWRLGWLTKVSPSDSICILGSGLTMIDQVLTLRAHGHRGPIHVLSRRGLVSHPHGRHGSAPVKPQLPAGTSAISSLLHALRSQVREGIEWRSLMDGLRPETQSLWKRLSADQRGRFLRHALPWWNIHRHRVAPDVFARLDALRESGTVLVHAGFIDKIEAGDQGVEIGFRKRGQSVRSSIKADWIINCTGMERAGITHSPLLKAMVEQALIVPDPQGLGISVDAQSRVLGPTGVPQQGLFAVGALTAGTFWEITAVPDIRVQARQVAQSCAQFLKSPEQA